MADQNKDQDEENPDKKPLRSEKFYKESSSGAVILQVRPNVFQKFNQPKTTEG
jgi:hypothetical protein